VARNIIKSCGRILCVYRDRRIETLLPISVTVHDVLQAAKVIYEAQGKTGLNIYLKIWAVISSERSVFTCTNTHCHNTEDLNLNICSCETSNFIVVFTVYLSVLVAVPMYIQII